MLFRRNTLETAEQQRRNPQDHRSGAAAHKAGREAEQKNFDV
jgi:hypothetical protein